MKKSSFKQPLSPTKKVLLPGKYYAMIWLGNGIDTKLLYAKSTC